MKDKVLEYMQENGYITTYIANDEFGIVELKPIIDELREDGYTIIERPVKIKRGGKKITYIKYILEGDKDE